MFNPGNYLARFDLARLRPYGMASIILFALGALGGGLAIIFYPETASHLQDLLKQFAKMFQGMPKLKLAACDLSQQQPQDAASHITGSLARFGAGRLSHR